MPLDRTTLHAIAELADDKGVLSVYVTADPREESGTRPAWQVRIRNKLAALRDELNARGERQVLYALTERLEDLASTLNWLLDPRTPGLGRALFAPLRGGDVRTLSVQVPLADLVVLQPVAFLRPLVSAWADGMPAGIVAVSANGLRMVDYRFGLTRDVAELHYEVPAPDHELQGPGGASIAQRSAQHRDLFERRRQEHLGRFLTEAGERVGALCAEFDWSFLVLTGERELVDQVAAGLPPQDVGYEVIRASHVVSHLSPPHIAAVVEPDLAAARTRRSLRLAEQAREAALSGQAGTLGLGDTLNAIAERRVAHLLLERDRDWSGHRAPDGRLSAGDEMVPGVDPKALVEEPQLAERMIESVLHQNGEVTLVNGEAAQLLAEGDGVAAILRW